MVAREQAQADKQTAVTQAGISRDERVSVANAEVREYNASIEAYQINPISYRLDRYLEAVESALSGRKKYLVGTGVDTGSLYSGAFRDFNGLAGQQNSQATQGQTDSQSESGAAGKGEQK